MKYTIILTTNKCYVLLSCREKTPNRIMKFPSSSAGHQPHPVQHHELQVPRRVQEAGPPNVLPLQEAGHARPLHLKQDVLQVRLLISTVIGHREGQRFIQVKLIMSAG